MEWRVCTEAPDYAVSSEGQVKRIATGKILRPSESRGYLHVIVMINEKRFCRSIHRLVAYAFLGQPPSSRHQAAHWDGNRKNNSSANLRWATPLENHADKLRHRTLHVRSWNSKLCETDIERIRDMARCGVAQLSIAKQFAVQSAHISKIVRGLKWRQLA